MSRWLKWVPVIVVPGVFGFALWILAGELRHHGIHEIRSALQALPGKRVALAALLTLASYGILACHDWFGLRYAGQRLGWAPVAFTSFVACVFSYNIGLSGLGGAAVRYRLYTGWGLAALDIGKVVLFIMTTFWLGMAAALGGALALGFVAEVHLPFGPTSVRLLGGLLLVVVAAYLVTCVWRQRPLLVRGLEVRLPRPRLALVQVGLGAVDVLLAGTVLFALFPGEDVSFGTFLGVYLVSIAAGALSHVPGGLGVFETVLLLTLPTAAPGPELVAMLVAYRAVYYLLPFCCGLALVGAHELARQRHRLAGWGRVISRGLGLVTPRVMTFAVFLAGLVLLASGATPSVHSRLGLLGRLFPVGVIELSHFLASLAGVALLFLARGLQLRLNAAWAVAMALLLAGVVLSLVKGGDFEEAGALGLTAAALGVSRSRFSRRSSLWDQRFSPGWLVAIALVLAGTTWLGFFAYRHVEYSNELWWTFQWTADAPRFLRASVGVATLVLVLGLARLFRLARSVPAPTTAEEIEAAMVVAAAAPTGEPNLVALGDKRILFSESRCSFIMYGVSGRSWVALGDPVGREEEASELVWEFREQCDAAATWPVFYEVSPARLPLYIELGLSLFKLGEEARVSLPEFSLEGRKRKSLRHGCTRAEREGCRFTVWEPEQVRARLADLERVSQAWLIRKRAREKGFSLGWFKPDYVTRFPAAVIEQHGRIVAFATVWRSAGRNELSVDLMRQVPDAPDGVMDYLFASLMLQGKAEGFRWFNLGMAPFSGIALNPLAPLWNRFGGLLFRQGEQFYNFRGLRAYKEKYEPQWEARYLASPGGLILPQVLAQVAALISSGVSGLVRK